MLCGKFQVACNQFRPTSKGDTLFGSAILKEKNFICIYRTTEDIEGVWYHRKYMIAARIAENDFADFNRWRFYTDGEWRTDFTKASRICPDIANEYSVSLQPSLGRQIYDGLYGNDEMTAEITDNSHLSLGSDSFAKAAH